MRYSKSMTKEGHTYIPKEDLRKDYSEAEAELQEIGEKIGVVHKHYGAEISTYDEVNTLVPEGETNPFADEHKVLIESRKAELNPLTDKERELTARLRRLYVTAWNEATRKENIEKRVQEYQEVLPAVKEMHKEIEHMYLEIDAVNQQTGRIVREANELAQSLEILLLKKVPTDEDEKEIRRTMETLVEVYGRITNMEHRIVHSGVSAPRE